MKISVENQRVSINNQKSQVYLGPVFGIQTASLAIAGVVNAIVEQPDGKIIVGGRFRHYGDTMARNLIRLLPDGTPDKDFNIGEGLYTVRSQSNNLTKISDNSSVTGVALQPDGKIVAIGNFATASGVICNSIVRYTNSGSIDQDFNQGIGLSITNDYLVQAQKDNKLIVTGTATSYSGSSVSTIFRINTSGSLDTTFNTGTGLSRTPEALLIQSDGKIVVTGLLFSSGTTYSGSTAPIGALRILPDGRIDSDFFLGSGFNVGPYSLAQQSDGKLLFGGVFSSFSGSGANRLVRLLPSGALDTSFPSQVSLGSDTVYKILQQQDGKIIAATQINTIGRLFRFGVSGGLDPTLPQSIYKTYVSQVPTGSYYPGSDNSAAVEALIQTLDGKIILGGRFSNYSQSADGLYDGIVAIEPSGSISTNISFSGGFRMPKRSFVNTIYSSSVNTIIEQPDGKILLGGSFTRLFGVGYPTSSFNRIIRILPNGKPDPDFNIGSGFNEDVTSLFLQQDGKILATGYFTNYSDSLQNRIVRINPSGNIDTDFNTGVGLEISQSQTDYHVKKFTVIQQQDAKIVVVGAFTTYNEISSSGIVRINPSGSIDLDFNKGTGFEGSVFYPSDIIQQSDQKLVAVGRFANYSGSVRNRIVRINPSGSIDTTFAGTASFDLRSSNVFCVYQQSDGKLLFGGSMDKYSGSTVNGIVRTDLFGRIDADFNTGQTDFTRGFTPSTLYAIPTVNKIIERSDGTIYVGGIFSEYNSVNSIDNCSNLVRLSASGSLIQDFGIFRGIQDAVYDIKESITGNMMIGGVFTNYQTYLNQGFLGVTPEGRVANYTQTEFKNTDP